MFGGKDLARHRSVLENAFAEIDNGLLTFKMPDGTSFVVGKNGNMHDISVADVRFFSELFKKGDLGLGTSYVEGFWSTTNLPDLLLFLSNARQNIKINVYGSNWFYFIFELIRHRLNDNTIKQSEDNIFYHYDLGNNFFKLWLDENMNYSSALFNGQNIDLKTAQLNKHQRILSQIQVDKKDSILDIGCGWGAFLDYANRSGLSNISGITISPAQFDYATRRLPNADIKMLDYRKIDKVYDKIVSIEMFEALGARWWPKYFSKIYESLKSGGTALIQVIVIADEFFKDYKKGVDFLQHYIFPGGMLPSVNVFTECATKAGFKLQDIFFFGADYTKTLNHWNTKFDAMWPQIKLMGFDEKFKRMWNYYLAYCMAGFSGERINVAQFQLQKA